MFICFRICRCMVMNLVKKWFKIEAVCCLFLLGGLLVSIVHLNFFINVIRDFVKHALLWIEDVLVPKYAIVLLLWIYLGNEVSLSEMWKFTSDSLHRLLSTTYILMKLTGSTFLHYNGCCWWMITCNVYCMYFTNPFPLYSKHFHLWCLLSCSGH